MTDNQKISDKQLELKFDLSTTKFWTFSEIQDKLITNELWRIRALFKLWELTISGRKRDRRGFNKEDIKVARTLVNDYRVYKNFIGWQLKWIEKEIPKYSKQLFEIIHDLR